MNKTQWRRVAEMEQAGRASMPGAAKISFDFPEALREARLRAAAGDPIPQTPITEEMMQDPVQGQLWRRIHEARERVRRLRK